MTRHPEAERVIAICNDCDGALAARAWPDGTVRLIGRPDACPCGSTDFAVYDTGSAERADEGDAPNEGDVPDGVTADTADSTTADTSSSTTADTADPPATDVPTTDVPTSDPPTADAPHPAQSADGESSRRSRPE